MENSRDSSVWRSLAVAFGDGLAFGVGMTLTHKAGRREPLPRLEAGAPSDRLSELENRLAALESAGGRLDPILQAVVRALEERLEERDAQWAARLQGSAQSIAEAARREGDERAATVRQESAELIKVLRQDVVEDLRTLEDHAVSFQQEIVGALARTLDERVAAALEKRLGELEKRLADEMALSVSRAEAAAAQGAADAVSRQLAAAQALIEQREQEAAQLRQSLAANEARTRDLLIAIGEACCVAANQIAPQAAVSDEPAPTAATGGTAEVSPEPAPDKPPHQAPPLFSVEPARAWHVPLVSTLVLTGGCLACLHWL